LAAAASPRHEHRHADEGDHHEDDEEHVAEVTALAAGR
jgi:hypothetical protein